MSSSHTGGLAAPSRSSVFGSAVQGPSGGLARPQAAVQRPSSAGTFRSVTSSRASVDERIRQERERMQQARSVMIAAAAVKQRASEEAYHAVHAARPTSARVEPPRNGPPASPAGAQRQPANVRPASSRAARPNTADGRVPPRPPPATARARGPETASGAQVFPHRDTAPAATSATAAVAPARSPRPLGAERPPWPSQPGPSQSSSVRQQPSRIHARAQQCGGVPPSPKRSGSSPALLGKGVFARVRLGNDEHGQPVAIKVYDHKEAQEHEYVAHHLQNEAKLAGKLEHENIIAPRKAVHRAGRTEFEMEYAPGGNLGDYVAKRRGLTEPEARRIFAQLVEGVGYLHAKNIAHRDLKLENVVLGGDGSAKIVDFGAAREGGDALTRSVQGTPAYMAPECHRGAPHRATAADLWSLGVLLHTLLVHGSQPGVQYPFWGKDIDELKRNINAAPLVLAEGLSEQCRDLLSRLLVRDPTRRMTIEEVRRHPWLRARSMPQRPAPQRGERAVQEEGRTGGASSNPHLHSVRGAPAYPSAPAQPARSSPGQLAQRPPSEMLAAAKAAKAEMRSVQAAHRDERPPAGTPIRPASARANMAASQQGRNPEAVARPGPYKSRLAGLMTATGGSMPARSSGR